MHHVLVDHMAKFIISWKLCKLRIPRAIGTTDPKHFITILQGVYEISPCQHEPIQPMLSMRQGAKNNLI